MNKCEGNNIFFYDDNNVFAFGEPYIKITPDLIEVRGQPPIKCSEITDIDLKTLARDRGSPLDCLISGDGEQRINKIVYIQAKSRDNKIGKIKIDLSKLSLVDVEILNHEVCMRLPHHLKNFEGFYDIS
jgi:hypothetical protein